MQKVAAALRGWDVPALVCWSDSDPVFPMSTGEAFHGMLPGAKDPLFVVKDASHMLQEDKGEVIADRIVAWAGPGS